METRSVAAGRSASRLSAETRVWIGFGAMCVGMFMAILDIQVVASSLTNIQSALKIPPDQLSWIQTAYLNSRCDGCSPPQRPGSRSQASPVPA